jgi:hypothetical protein
LEKTLAKELLTIEGKPFNSRYGKQQQVRKAKELLTIEGKPVNSRYGRQQQVRKQQQECQQQQGRQKRLKHKGRQQ